ncbi:MAG: DUF2799 domain-containing protein [Desulfobulbaceae bacterium]|nr:DUF2799 domain-containing protein [Desulfobulbaceae bacterium]
MRHEVLFGLFSGIVLLTNGCATMNESECRHADWRIIGMEDGASGKQSSHIGRHRSACAKYGVIPNLNQYLLGYDQGLVQYCTEQSGYSVGKSGEDYNGICPQGSEALFLEGYRRGREIYLLQQEIQELREAIYADEATIGELKDTVRANEQEILREDISQMNRGDLLRSVKKMEREIGRLQMTIRERKNDLEAWEIKLDEISGYGLH